MNPRIYGGGAEDGKFDGVIQETNNIQILEQYTVNEPPRSESQNSSSRPTATISLN